MPSPLRCFRCFAVICSACSAVALAVLWVRSYDACDDVSYANRRIVGADCREWHFRIYTSRGGLAITVATSVFSDLGRPAAVRLENSAPLSIEFSRWKTQGYALGGADVLGNRGVLGFIWRSNERRMQDRPCAFANQMARVFEYRERAIALPCWFLVLGCSVMPAMWLAGARSRRLARRKKAGLCTQCGYDLRATSDRCPECGTAVPEGHKPEVSPETLVKE